MRALAALVFVLACGKGKGNDTTAAVGSGSAGSATVATGLGSAANVSVALPEVAGHGFETRPPPPARITIAPSAIVVDGKQVLALENGTVPATAVTDGTIPAIVGGLSASGGSDPRIVIALDRQVTFAVLYQVLLTLKTQGVRSFGILARRGDATVMLPIDLPERRPPDQGDRGRVRPGSDLADQIREVKERAPSRPATPTRESGAAVEVLDAEVTPPSSLDGEGVKRKVSAAYVAGVKRCVTSMATRDATPGGSVAVTFTINETGRAGDGAVTGLPKDVADCIVNLIASWRFPLPRDNAMNGVRVAAKVTLDVTFHDAGPAVSATNGVGSIVGTVEDIRELDTRPAPAEPALGLTLDVGPQLTLFSTSGSEGTLPKPRLQIAPGPTAAADLGKVLEEIVTKRWPDGKRANVANREIAVLFAAATPMQAVAEILGAVRATPAGRELFPVVILGPSLAEQP